MNLDLKVKTIGVYGKTESEFFETLKKNNIDTFIDIRRRRGVRGAKYSFVNSTKLQNRLKELNINYIYEINLAPTSEIRELQKTSDKKHGIVKRDRNRLGTEFILAYKSEIITKYNFEQLLHSLKNKNAKNIVLFCVEEEAEACHRSLVTDHLRNIYSIETGDI